jgi:hypothetical protein
MRCRAVAAMAVKTAERTVTLAALMATAGCTSARDAPIMTWPRYASLSVRWPYVIRFDPSRGSLLYYGASHTYSTTDPQVAEIERLWTSFRPTMAFNEGGHPPIEATITSAVERYGEPGLVRFLAARDDIPVASLDPERAEEVAHLRQSFPATDVKLFFVLRAIAQFAERKGPDGVDVELERVLAIYNATPGLGASPRTISEVAAAFGDRFPDSGSYRMTPLRWFDPVESDTVLNRISRASNDYRDRAIVAVLGRSVADGQRVFAVVGGTHVVMQEQALTSTLGVRGRRASDGMKLRRIE